jgi:Protein of unknown function (DUF2905)
MSELGRILIGLGLLLILVGAGVLVLGRIGFPLGKLPGDFAYKGKNVSFYFPLASSIVISLLLSLIFLILARFRR